MITTIFGAGLNGAITLDVLRKLDPLGSSTLLEPVSPDGGIVLAAPALPVLSPCQAEGGQDKLSVLTSLKGSAWGWQDRLGEAGPARFPYSWNNADRYSTVVGYDAVKFYLSLINDPDRWFLSHIKPFDTPAGLLHGLVMQLAERGPVINTLPMAQFCLNEEDHLFASATLWASEAAAPKSQIDDSIVLNGDPNGPGWTVSIALGGWRTVVYTGNRVPPFDDLRKVMAPYRTTCDCTKSLPMTNVGNWAHFDGTMTAFAAHAQATRAIEKALAG